MGNHQVRYQVLNRHNMSREASFRDIKVHATTEELDVLDESGYLVKEQLFQADHLEKLRASTDHLFESEVDGSKRKTNERSWGAILRYLEDKDPLFLDLIQFEPIVSIARAMMGPAIRLRGLSARISWPGDEIQSAPYHQHLRVNLLPRPPWFSDPHGLDALIYLDDLDKSTGPVCVVPGSHKWNDREPPSRHFDPLDNEVVLRVSAGSTVLMHSNIWHRTYPTVSANRRMLILSYVPCWLRRSPHGVKPENGLTSTVLENASEELRELLGVSGYS